MIRWFILHALGYDPDDVEKSGKRESAWFGFLVWMAFTGWLVWLDVSHPEVPLALTTVMWQTITPFVFVWFAAAHGFDWFSKQTGYGGGNVLLSTKSPTTEEPGAEPAAEEAKIPEPESKEDCKCGAS